MSFQIRSASEGDLPAMAEVLTATFPHHPETAKTLSRFMEKLRASPLQPHNEYWVAEADSQVVAVAQLWQAPWMFHPERYHAELTVHPDWQRQGIGTRLAYTMQARLQELDAKEVMAGSYETTHHALRMLEARGFREAKRFVDNVLELQNVNFAEWEKEMQLPEGLRIVTLAELMTERGEDDAMHAYHDCHAEVRRDVPRTGQVTPIPFEKFAGRLSDPTFFPAGVLLAATEAGEVVGLSELWKTTEPQRLNIGLTGTRRDWRRKGVALALKLHGMELARELGAQEIWTGNAASNMPMLTLNTRLGFKARPAYVECQWGSV